MSDSDSDPSTSLPSPVAAGGTKSKSKAKGSSQSKTKGQKSKTAAGPVVENDSTWAFEPPEGMSAIEDVGDDNGEWDWDAFEQDSELELWVIRVPNGIKPKHLENLTTDVPDPSSSKTKVGVLNRKHESYDVWNLDSDSVSTSSGGAVGGVEITRESEAGPAAAAGGEEMNGLTCLLPSKKKKRGEFYIAPRPISRRLIVSAQPPKPSEDVPENSTLKQNPPRFSYPKEMLKHRFVAFGSTKGTAETDYGDDDGERNAGKKDAGDDRMDVDPSPPAKPEKAKAKEKKSTKESKETKKRKTAEGSEADLPSLKKHKKSKKPLVGQ